MTGSKEIHQEAITRELMRYLIKLNLGGVKKGTNQRTIVEMEMKQIACRFDMVARKNSEEGDRSQYARDLCSVSTDIPTPGKSFNTGLTKVFGHPQEAVIVVRFQLCVTQRIIVSLTNIGRTGGRRAGGER